MKQGKDDEVINNGSNKSPFPQFQNKQINKQYPFLIFDSKLKQKSNKHIHPPISNFQKRVQQI